MNADKKLSDLTIGDLAKLLTQLIGIVVLIVFTFIHPIAAACLTFAYFFFKREEGGLFDTILSCCWHGVKFVLLICAIIGWIYWFYTGYKTHPTLYLYTTWVPIIVWFCYNAYKESCHPRLCRLYRFIVSKKNELLVHSSSRSS